MPNKRFCLEFVSHSVSLKPSVCSCVVSHCPVRVGCFSVLHFLSGTPENQIIMNEMTNKIPLDKSDLENHATAKTDRSVLLLLGLFAELLRMYGTLY